MVKFFERTIQEIFSEEKLSSRIYMYSPKIKRLDAPFLSKTKLYVDTRARKPYYIYRISKRSLVKQWKELVKKYALAKEMYRYILQGFFAGEGNIKFHRSSHSRTVRIAQGGRNKLLEVILKDIYIKRRYSPAERAYVITGRKNIDKLAEIKIATLHPEKEKKFREIFATYKQYHYPKHYFKNKIYTVLKRPHTSLELAKTFNRSVAHVQETLKKLKDERKIQIFRLRSKALWIRTDQNVILLSDVKRRYLHLLEKYRKLTTAFIARKLGVDWHSAHRRLKELETLRLAKRNLNGRWELCATSKHIQTPI